MNSQFERAKPPQQSLSIAHEVIADLGLRAIDRAYGSDLQTYSCKLIDDQQKLIFYGFGKGLGLQSKVSAYYEALEHFVIHQFALMEGDKRENYKIINGYECDLPCVSVKDIHSNEFIQYPLFMLDPRYGRHPCGTDRTDYSKHAWQACDNGVASGTNITEASIHALNELVERDAHSLFLIEAFIKKKGQRLKLIDKLTLPANQLAIVKKIEQEFDDELMIFDITSDSGIPVMYVSMTRQPLLIQPSGCGASLYAEYALERALLETLQPVHVQNMKMHDNQHSIIRKLQDYPLLLKAAIADTTALQNHSELSAFRDMAGSDSHFSLSDQLRIIIDKIQSMNCKIYNLTIMNHTSGFSCVKYVIPEFEQFHLVQTGKRILPKKRGLALLNRND